MKKRIENNNIIIDSTSKNVHSMKIINLKLGHKTTIEIQNIPEYTWYYETKPDWIVSMVQEYSLPFKSNKTSDENQSNSNIYTITPLKKGEVIIRFYAVKAWENDSKPNKEIFYTIVVE